MDKQTALKTNTPPDDAGATDILRADHAQARKDLAEYRRLMDEHAETRSALAQDICMQIELHDLVEREIFYPAIEPQAHDAVDSALRHTTTFSSACSYCAACLWPTRNTTQR
jgi:hypothetical protein